MGFIVFTGTGRAAVRFYNKRGTAEQDQGRIKEGKQAAAMTRLACYRFRANEVRLWLSVIAYNLGNLWRRLALPKATGNWADQPAVAVGEDRRVIKHARYCWLLPAEGHLTRQLFARILSSIAALPLRAG
jgi:hypothetical protein